MKIHAPDSAYPPGTNDGGRTPDLKDLPPETAKRLVGYATLMMDETRLRILWALSERELPVHAITEAVGGSQPGISRNLKMLLDAGFLRMRRDGRNNMYGVTRSYVEETLAFGAHFGAASSVRETPSFTVAAGEPEASRDGGEDEGVADAGRTAGVGPGPRDGGTTCEPTPLVLRIVHGQEGPEAVPEPEDQGRRVERLERHVAELATALSLANDEAAALRARIKALLAERGTHAGGRDLEPDLPSPPPAKPPYVGKDERLYSNALENRRRMYEFLAPEGSSIAEIAEALDVSVQAVGVHLKKMQAAGAVRAIPVDKRQSLYVRVAEESVGAGGAPGNDGSGPAAGVPPTDDPVPPADGTTPERPVTDGPGKGRAAFSGGKAEERERPGTERAKAATGAMPHAEGSAGAAHRHAAEAALRAGTPKEHRRAILGALRAMRELHGRGAELSAFYEEFLPAHPGVTKKMLIHWFIAGEPAWAWLDGDVSPDADAGFAEEVRPASKPRCPAHPFTLDPYQAPSDFEAAMIDDAGVPPAASRAVSAALFELDANLTSDEWDEYVELAQVAKAGKGTRADLARFVPLLRKAYPFVPAADAEALASIMFTPKSSLALEAERKRLVAEHFRFS